MAVSDWISLTAFLAAMSFSPGPNTMLSTALAAQGGLRKALPFVCGVPIGWGILLLICASGVGAALEAYPAMRGVLTLMGVVYLLWLAWRLHKAERGAVQSSLGEVAPDPARPAGWSVGFGQGVLLQFVNPKAWMNAVLVVSGWIDVESGSHARLLLVAPLVMIFGGLSNFSYALVGAGLRRWLSQGRRRRAFNSILALALALVAIWMLAPVVFTAFLG